MHKYKNEAIFRINLCNAFAEQGVFTQKIESSGMNKGIPDMLACKGDKVLPIELKRLKSTVLDKSIITVDWRTGQQAWALLFRKYMNYPTLTVIAADDAFLLLPMDKTYPENKVPFTEFITIEGSIKYLVKSICHYCALGEIQNDAR